MAELRFHNVPPEGFIAFANELSVVEWGAIDTTPYAGPNQTTTQPFFDIPILIAYKLLLIWVIDTLVGVRENTGNAKDADQNWDDAQRRLRSMLEMWAAHRDALKREAAARLRKALLLGAGTAQTKLGYHQEVDFGQQQLITVSTGQAAADITLLGLEAAIEDIRQATNALAEAIGYGHTSGRPFEQRQRATANCIATFENIAQGLAQISNHKGLDSHAAKLRVPFEALAARYPATSDGAATGEESPPPEDDTLPSS
jgi:hypothetical protein